MQSEKYLPFVNKEDFSQKIQIKTTAPYLFKKVLEKLKPGGLICFGSATDPYQPIEEKYQITRSLLEIILKFRYPLQIITKSPLIRRDLKLIKEISAKVFCTVSFSLITLNGQLVKIFEPMAPSPQKRLETIQELARAGINVGITLMPLLPYITEGKELEKVFFAAESAGAEYILPGLLTLRDNVRDRFFNLLKQHFPRLLHRYTALYDRGINPSINYVQRINSELNQLSKKYGLPLCFPTADSKIVKFPRQGEFW